MALGGGGPATQVSLLSRIKADAWYSIQPAGTNSGGGGATNVRVPLNGEVSKMRSFVERQRTCGPRVTIGQRAWLRATMPSPRSIVHEFLARIRLVA
jgi:hypothetical protein